MGSDTCGSIRIPASVNSLVGLRPTQGLSSIAGIVPLSTTQDVGGPLARTVTDLAVMLDATVGEDQADPATHLAAGQARPKFVNALQAGALHGARIGILEPLFGDASDDAEVIRIVRQATEELKTQGAATTLVQMKELTEALNGSSVIALEFKEDLAQYLAAYGSPRFTRSKISCAVASIMRRWSRPSRFGWPRKAVTRMTIGSRWRSGPRYS